VALKIRKDFEEQDNCWTVEISGEVDIHTSGNLKDTLNTLLNEKETDLKINCEKLIYIDSTGLGVLIGVLKRVKMEVKFMRIVQMDYLNLQIMGETGLQFIMHKLKM